MDAEGVIFVVVVSLIILTISSSYCNVYIYAIYQQVPHLSHRILPTSSSTHPSTLSSLRSYLSAIFEQYSPLRVMQILLMYSCLTQNSKYTPEQI